MDLEKLLHSLTLEEKIGQLVMIPPFFFIKNSDTEIAGPLSELGITEQEVFQTGSVLGIGNAEEMIQVQTMYLEKSRHKIPLIFMADIIHGYETIFPVPLALAASFDDKVVYDAARISATEASTAGIHVTFAPMLDLVRDPRWGRVVESFGEDPYLSTRFAKLQVEGYQNGDISKSGHIASCLKHFVGYGLSEAGRDYNTVDISRINLYENYLKAFKGGIDAGAKMVMTAFNVFEGIPATTNQYLLKDVLRNDLGFDGVIISDYASLKEVIAHGVAEDGYDAAVQGIDAGLHIEMATAQYIKHLKDAVKRGDVKEADIDLLVMDVLKLKKEAGLFENPFKGASLDLEKDLVRAPKHVKRAQEAAESSIVMLKNNGTFPINGQSKIALIGRYANNPHLNGPWSWHGSKHQNETLYEVFKKDMNITYMHDGMDVDLRILKQADIILIAAGENEKDSGEAHSKTSIKLPYGQASWIQDIKRKTNKPIGLILFNGRPLDLSDVVDEVDAIFECFFPGTKGAKAISNILLGKVNPSGKLPMTFLRDVGQIPIYYNHLSTGRPYHVGGEYTSFYLDMDNSPLFPFGYGLSYSKFKFENFKLSKDTITLHETLKVSVDVTNESHVPGYEVVQLYLKDHVATVARPTKSLIEFKKIWIEPNETVNVSFELTKEDLSYIGSNLKPRVDNGDFSLMVGPNSNDLIQLKFKLKTKEETS